MFYLRWSSIDAHWVIFYFAIKYKLHVQRISRKNLAFFFQKRKNTILAGHESCWTPHQCTFVFVVFSAVGVDVVVDVTVIEDVTTLKYSLSINCPMHISTEKRWLFHDKVSVWLLHFCFYSENKWINNASVCHTLIQPVRSKTAIYISIQLFIVTRALWFKV